MNVEHERALASFRRASWLTSHPEENDLVITRADAS